LTNILKFKSEDNEYFLDYTEEFSFELGEILAYVTENYYYDTAYKLKSKLEEKIHILKNNPFAFEEYEENPKYRYLIVKKYKILYNVDSEHKVVYLEHIVDARRKYFHLV